MEKEKTSILITVKPANRFIDKPKIVKPLLFVLNNSAIIPEMIPTTII